MTKKTPRNDGWISEEEIARCAYQIWESEGRPEGRAAEHWAEAEARLRSEHQQTTAPTARSVRPRKAPARPASATREKRVQVLT